MSNVTSPSTSPTVVLVHGAFADGSSWAGVIERLQADGIDVRAIVNPLRGLAEDSGYVANYLGQILGRVLLVGHSYGGAVITNAAANADNVAGLVFVAAFAPDEGETLLQVESDSRDSVLASALDQLTYLDAGNPEIEFIVRQNAFHDAFAADLPAAQASIMQAAQRPASSRAFSEPTRAAAWKRLPSWAIVATGDRAAGADVIRSMARRAKADTIEAAGSHVIMVSQPEIVANHIKKALAAVSEKPIAV